MGGQKLRRKFSFSYAYPALWLLAILWADLTAPFSTALAASNTKHQVTIWTPSQVDIQIRIGYSLGTHKLHSKVMLGQLVQKREALDSLSGSLAVPVRRIQGGNQKLECHLQSSLGIDYSLSRFPAEHVCDSTNQLPETGPDSIAFPEVKLTIEGLKKVSDSEYEVLGQWNIHGVHQATSQTASPLRLRLESKGDQAMTEGSTQFRLKDFGIVVKRAFVISVSEVATMNWSIAFKKSQSTSINHE